VSQPFFLTEPGGERAQGNPAHLLTSVAWQDDATRPPVSGFYDFISEGGAGAPARLFVPQLGLRGSTMGQVSLVGKTDFPTGPLGLRDADPMNLAQLMFAANALEYILSDEPDTGHFFHRMSTQVQAESGAVAVPPMLCMKRDDGKGQPIRMEHIRVRRLTIDVRSRGNARLIVEYVVGRFDFHGPVTQTVGTGATPPRIRGVDYTAAFADDTVDKKTKIKVISTAVGSAVIQSAQGAASYDAGSQQTLYADVETKLLRGAAGDLFGDHGDAVAIIASAADIATWAADDEFEAAQRMPRWSPSYVAAYPIPETHARLWYWNGSSFERLSAQGGFSVVIDWPGAVRDEDIGYAQALGTLRTGEKVVTVNLSRTFSDLTVEKQILTGSYLPLVLELLSNTRAAGADYLSYAWVLPYVIGENTPGYSVPQGAGPAPPNTAYRLLAKEPPVGSSGLTWPVGGTAVTAEVELHVHTEVENVVPA
jgi:hypothetical protein